MTTHLHGRIVYFLTAFLCAFQLAGYAPRAGTAYAEELPGCPVEEACDFECWGRKNLLPPRIDEYSLSLVLGGSIYTPELAGHTFAPIGALYFRDLSDDIRVRGVFSIFVNELSVSKTRDQFQLLGYIDNRTYPFVTTENEAGKEVSGTAVKWGTVNGRLGAGWRLPVSPFQIDNDLRVQLYYQLGYLYSKRVSDTGPDVVLPPDTTVHGPLLRVRYDGLQRNLMELPHRGAAAGMDAQYLTRSHWSAADYGGLAFKETDTKQFLKLSGYLIVATALPYLSDKDRLIASVHGGFVPYGVLDRFSTFRIGGGPITSDSDELDRQVFPGAMFNQFPVYGYVFNSLEYRREIYPFLYFHLSGTHANISRELFTDSPHGHFLTENGVAVTTGLTSGFFGNSELHIGYTYDYKVLRDNYQGSNIVLLWSKSY